MRIGERVGAVRKADDETVYLLGYGTYDGNHVPPSGWLHELGIANPRITLDDGRVVWGHECWWGSEEEVRAGIGDRRVEIVG